MTNRLPDVTVYDDDTDAHLDRIITDVAGTDLTFAPLVAIGSGPFDVAATWQGSAGSSRVLRIPVSALPIGPHHLYLAVPGNNDLDLGVVKVIARS